MCTLVLLAPIVTAATTGLMPAVRPGFGWPRSEEARTDFRPPRMNWVVAADGNGDRRMRMRWAPSAEDR